MFHSEVHPDATEFGVAACHSRPVACGRRADAGLRGLPDSLRSTSIALSFAAAMLAGCARMTAGPRVETRAPGARTSSAVPMPAAIGDGESVPMKVMDHGPANDVAGKLGYAGQRSDWVWERPSAKTMDALLVAYGGGSDGTFPTQTPVQSGDATMAGMPTGRAAQRADAEMTGMPTGRAASQAGSMTEMMGAPGLVPFDVMTGQAGRWMVGYQFMIEQLDGNLDGTRDVSNAEVLATYPTSPTDMTMQMHMAMVMYAPTDRMTLMAMLPYVKMTMGELHGDGSRSTERSEGLGDLELRGMYSLYAAEDHHHTLLANFGVGLPTGSIEARDPEGERMEYPMQIGSGTYSLLPGFTYLGQSLPWGWAADFHAVVRVGRNDVGYRLGNRYQASVSTAREFSSGVSLSTGLRGELWENITGADPLLNPADEPTKDPKLQGGRRLGAFFGVALHPEYGPLEGQHFHAQFELPLAESLDGPQLKRSWVLRIGWQLEF